MPGRKRPGGRTGIDVVTLALRLRAAMQLHDEYRGEGTQKVLAAAAGVDPGNLSRMLRGEGGKEVTVATMLRLADALDVTLGWLANGEGGTEPVRASRTPLPSSSVAPRSSPRSA